MKTIRTIVIAACAFAAATISGFAQPKQNEEWRNKMKSEMVAFITTELNLSPEEAQTFWPVYNQAAEKRFKRVNGVMDVMRQMFDGDEEKDYAALMKSYEKALKEREEAEIEYLATIRKAFGDEKAAKLIVAEEKFRRNQIHRLNGGQRQGQHGPDGRPGGPDGAGRPGGHGPDGRQGGNGPDGAGRPGGPDAQRGGWGGQRPDGPRGGWDGTQSGEQTTK